MIVGSRKEPRGQMHLKMKRKVREQVCRWVKVLKTQSGEFCVFGVFNRILWHFLTKDVIHKENQAQNDISESYCESEADNKLQFEKDHICDVKKYAGRATSSPLPATGRGKGVELLRANTSTHHSEGNF